MNLLDELGLPQPKYTQGPQGNTVHDYSMERQNGVDDKAPFASHYEDRRDNRDPTEVYNQIVTAREVDRKLKQADDERENGNGHREVKLCFGGPHYYHSEHLWTEDRPGGKTFWCPGGPIQPL